MTFELHGPGGGNKAPPGSRQPVRVRAPALAAPAEALLFLARAERKRKTRQL